MINHFKPIFHFYTTGFLTFSGGIEMEYWLKMGYEILWRTAMKSKEAKR